MNREQLLNRKPRIDTVDIDDDTLHLRAWTGVDRAAFIDASQDKDHGRTEGQQNEYLNALVVTSSACDENGALLFTEEDIPKIQDVLDAGTIQTIVNKAFKLNGLDTGAIEAAEKK